MGRLWCSYWVVPDLSVSGRELPARTGLSSLPSPVERLWRSIRGNYLDVPDRWSVAC